MSTRLLHKGKAKSVKIKIKKIKKIKIKRNCWVVGCRDSPAVVSILPVVCLVVEEVVQTDIQQKCAKEKVVAKWKTFLGTSIPTLVLARVNFFFSTSIFFVRVFFLRRSRTPHPSPQSRAQFISARRSYASDFASDFAETATLPKCRVRSCLFAVFSGPRPDIGFPTTVFTIVASTAIRSAHNIYFLLDFFPKLHFCQTYFL